MKYKIVFFIVVLISSSASLFGQYNFEWAKKAGGESLDASVTDNAGNTYVTGNFVNGSFGPYSLTAVNGYTDIFIAKYDSTGVCLWAKRCGGTGNDFGYGITLDKDQNCIVVGEISHSSLDTADFGPYLLPSIGQGDIFITKLDSAGNFIWAECAGGTFDDIAEAVDVDDAGNIYVGGRVSPGSMFGGVSAPSQGTFLAKYNSSGICQWVRNNNRNSIDNIYAVTTDSVGNSLVTGVFTTTATFGSFTLTSAGDGDIFMARYNNSGTCLMARRIGGTNTDSGKAIIEDSLGNFYVAGYFDETVNFGCSSFGNVSTGFETYVAKYDYNGICQWVTRGQGGNGNWPLAITIDRFGYVYVTGWFRQSINFNGIIRNTSGGTNEDIYLAKINPYGICSSIAQFGNINPDHGTGLGIDSFDNLYLSGFFQKTVDFNPTGAINNLTSVSSSSPDVFIVKYALCPPVFYQQDTLHCGNDPFVFPDGLLGGGSSSHISYLVDVTGCDSILDTDMTFIAIDVSVSLQTDTLLANDSTATYQWLDCDSLNASIPGATLSTFRPSNSGNYSVVINTDGCVDTSACYFVSLVNTPEWKTRNDEINIFPNPSSDRIFIEDKSGKFEYYVLTDMIGVSFTSGFMGDDSMKEVRLNDIPQGIYILRLWNKKGVQKNIKIVIKK